MSFYEYGGLIAEFGIAAILFVLAALIYQWKRYAQASAETEEKYSIYEGAILSKLAEKKGINLSKETIKREMKVNRKKEFRELVRSEMFDQMFKEEKGEKSPSSKI